MSWLRRVVGVDRAADARQATDAPAGPATPGGDPSDVEVSDPLLHFTEYDTRVAAYAVIIENGTISDERTPAGSAALSFERMLLTWYNGEGRHDPCWTLPGGGVEFDESVPDAAIREVYEETGYRIELGDVLTINTVTFPAEGRPTGRPFKSVQVIYRARVVDGELGTTEVGGTTDFARWLTLDELLASEAVAISVQAALAAL